MAVKLTHLEARDALLQIEAKKLDHTAIKEATHFSEARFSIRKTRRSAEDLTGDLFDLIKDIKQLDTTPSPPEKKDEARTLLIDRFYAWLPEATTAVNNIDRNIAEAASAERRYHAQIIRDAHVLRLAEGTSVFLKIMRDTIPAFREADTVDGRATQQPMTLPTPDEAHEAAKIWLQEELDQQLKQLDDLGGPMFTGWLPAQDSAGISLHRNAGRPSTVEALSEEHIPANHGGGVSIPLREFAHHLPRV
ncbi:hypothetical protein CAUPRSCDRAFT_12715 [Caulochytrium protostelioides]|uniref:Uncharacterized protein n=1 Tax=Caulochytrium protostelioides TaxID=1555241 RepID=A0A4V1IT26_9FUNG|nr:hypothetical protein CAUPRSCDRAFT_12715 [Caulochytrium protostelioides]